MEDSIVQLAYEVSYLQRHLRWALQVGNQTSNGEKGLRKDVKKSHSRSKSSQMELLQIAQSYLNYGSFQFIIQLKVQSQWGHHRCRLKYVSSTQNNQNSN
jgi:hypothetical protein